MNQNNVFFIDEINNLALADKKMLVNMSENMYHSQIDEIIKEILQQKIKIVLIAGPSSAGKTTTSLLLSQKLAKNGKNAIAVSLDDFFIDKDNRQKLPNGKIDYESIDALDLKGFNLFLNCLLETKSANMPKYNFITGKREKKYTPISFDENSILIIEGLHALNPKLINSNEKTYKIYLNLLSDFQLNNQTLNHEEVRLMRRMIRDLYSRGKSIKETIESWQDVMDGEKKYIDPYKDDANYKVDTTHMYEILLYANYLLPKISKCKLNSDNLSKFLTQCEKLDKNVIPNDSLLNEFIEKNKV